MNWITLSPFVAFSAFSTAILGLAGGRIERWAAAVFAGLLILTPVIQHDWPWAVPLSSFLVAGLLMWWALTQDRWWLIFAAGCQLLALSTHVVALVRLEDLMWQSITVRWLSWFVMMVIALFGAWEGWALERIRRANAQPA